MTRTVAQLKTLAIIPKCTGTMSLFGSSWIITEICTDREKKHNVYHRLLLAMSVYDVLESIWNVASTWPIPKGTEGVWGAYGTQQTCSTQGFFLQLGLAVVIYNAGLGVYYLLVIKYSFQEQRIARVFEPIMHATAFGCSFGTAIAALVLKLYNNANLWCWIAPLPANCGQSTVPCTRGNNAWIFRWAFYFIPLWLCIFLAMVALIMVYRAVLKREAATARYRHHATSVVEHDGNEDNNDLNRRKSSMRVMAKTMSRRLSSIMRRESVEEQQEQRNPRSRQVLKQAVWYLVAFYMTHTFSTVNRILQQVTGETYFPLIVLHSFFDPFQGFLNFMVYRRPRYVKYRKTFPQKSRWFAVKSTLRFSYVEQRNARRQQILQQLNQYQYSSSSIPPIAEGTESSDNFQVVGHHVEKPSSRNSGIFLLLESGAKNSNHSSAERSLASRESMGQSQALDGSGKSLENGEIARIRALTAVDEDSDDPDWPSSQAPKSEHKAEPVNVTSSDLNKPLPGEPLMEPDSEEFQDETDSPNPGTEKRFINGNSSTRSDNDSKAKDSNGHRAPVTLDEP